ncbi:MAG: hypothetical protein Q8R91_02000 [Candidatus Omnitrophota bacterium]|nr:hypothetical protein [Candidatus Omnitrophota bacterium]
MNATTADLNTEQVITRLPAVEGNVEQPPANPPPLPNQEARKLSPLWSSIIGGLIAAFITSTTMVVTNAWVVPTVARHQRRVDRMYQAMFGAAQFAGLLGGYTWNAWYERQRVVGATNKPVEDLQQVGARAGSLAEQLPLIFDDQVATEWQRIVDTYRTVAYPLIHPKEFPNLPTEQKMNEEINPLNQSANELVTRMRLIIQEAESRPWWRVLFLERNS